MRMEEYMEKLISQIRCKKARPYIESEIKDHIEEQIAFNKSKGMSDEEAEKNAVMSIILGLTIMCSLGLAFFH